MKTKTIILHAIMSIMLIVTMNACSGNASVNMDLRQRLQSSNPDIRFDAVSELAIVDGSEAEDLLIVALNDGNRNVRLTAAQLLGQRKVKKAVAPLIQKLKDNDIEVRAQAATALGDIGSEKATKPLIDLLEDSLARKPKGSYSTFDWGPDTDSAVEALVKITGQDFGLDVAKWRAWLVEKKT